MRRQKMPLNKSKGNMYDFVTHTFNTVKGKCPHECAYCYVKRWGRQPELHFDEKELKTDLGEGNFIFVGSSCDMWAENTPPNWIERTLNHCKKYNKNQYLFQTKYPQNFNWWLQEIPIGSILATTIESDKFYPKISPATTPIERASSMKTLKSLNIKTMVTIEPIMEFGLNNLMNLIVRANPDWVNIGADSGRNNLPEPSKEKIKCLIDALKFEGIEIKQKKNLERLLK
jgi:DNA repair photolyase